MTDKNTEINTLVQRKKDIEREGLQLTGKLLQLLEGIIPLAFEQSPSLESISWTQYAPYFNDGDACKFSVHDKFIHCSSAMELKASLLPKSMIKWDGTGYSNDELIEGKYGEGWEFEDFQEDSIIGKSLAPIFQILDVLSNDDYEETWGNGYKVTITKSGIEASEYSHD